MGQKGFDRKQGLERFLPERPERSAPKFALRGNPGGLQ